MRLRWLLGNFADPQHELSRREQFEISKLAHERYMPAWQLVRWTLVGIVLPALLLFSIALPPVLRMLGLAGSTLAMNIGVAVIVVLVWPLSAWVYGVMYTKPARRAMRDRGLDVCIGCGYLLESLPETVACCPECGSRRERGAAPAADDEAGH